MLFPILPIFSFFLLLSFPTAFAPGPSRENKLFIECAVRAPKSRHGPETVVSHAKMDNDRIILFGLGGNLYVGNSELSELCKEDKEFGRTSNMAPELKQGGSVEHCEDGKLTLNGKNLHLKSTNQTDYEQCFAGNYELFECPGEMCGGESALIFVGKRHEPKAKSYAFVHAGKMLVREMTVAEVSADQLDCVKKVCAEESVPLVEEAVRMRRRSKDEKKELRQDTDKFKVYKECAVKRRRVDANGKTMSARARMETLMAHVKMGKLVLFFGMGGNLYAGESNLASECEEDKLFTRSKVMAKRTTLLGCHNSPAESGGTARLTFRMGTDKIQMRIGRSRGARGSQCHAVQTIRGQGQLQHQRQRRHYDVYKCPRGECAGGDQLVLLRRKGNNNRGKLVSRGVLMTDEVLFSEVTPKQWQCVRQMCGPNVRIRSVEAVKRRTDKGAKGSGAQPTTGQRQRSADKSAKGRGAQPATGQRRRSATKRMGRKGNEGKREGANAEGTPQREGGGAEQQSEGDDQNRQKAGDQNRQKASDQHNEADH